MIQVVKLKFYVNLSLSNAHEIPGFCFNDFYQCFLLKSSRRYPSYKIYTFELTIFDFLYLKFNFEMEKYINNSLLESTK